MIKDFELHDYEMSDNGGLMTYFSIGKKSYGVNFDFPVTENSQHQTIGLNVLDRDTLNKVACLIESRFSPVELFVRSTLTDDDFKVKTVSTDIGVFHMVAIFNHETEKYDAIDDVVCSLEEHSEKICKPLFATLRGFNKIPFDKKILGKLTAALTVAEKHGQEFLNELNE